MNFLTWVKTTGIIAICFVLNSASFAQANFSANTTSGCAPLAVNFTDISGGNPTQWTWHFGDGAIAHIRNPSRVYDIPGDYTIKLVINTSNGVDSVIRTQYIHVYAKPVVNFSTSNSTGCTPLITNFNDLSTSQNGSIVTWNWDFGDGNLSTLRNPSHSYLSSGNFNVSLQTTNNFGCTSSKTVANFIQVNDHPNAVFTNSNVPICSAPELVSFNNTSSGLGSLTYNWTFGDGTTSTDSGAIVSHNYVTTGNFSVQLIVTNAFGCTDTFVKNNAVVIANNISGFNALNVACKNDVVTFTNTSAPTPTSTLWNFGNGSTAVGLNATHQFRTVGVYEIKLYNNFGACVDSVVRTITIKDLPTVDFTANPLSGCIAPMTANFTNTSTLATTYLWNFGDNTTSTIENPSHIYNTQGNYTISLTGTSANGCKNTRVRDQYVSIQLPVVTIRNMPQSGCGPLTKTFQHQVTGGDNIVSYFWDFGDGTTSTLMSPTHTFNVGTFDISLIIVTASGCTDTVVYSRGVRVGTRPHTAFDATPRITCAQFPVAFGDSTPIADSVNQWLWNFGDNTTSTLQNPLHVYVDTGYMIVTLVTAYNGCKDTLIIPDFVYINPPVANFKVIVDCSNRKKRKFVDQSIGADTWSWNFGDGATSTEQNPEHYYTANGPHSVTLTVFNNTTGCSFTKTTNIIIVDQHPTIGASSYSICKPGDVAFKALGVTPAYFNAFNWNFGDNSTGTGDSIIKRYYNSGIYCARLTSIDKNGCKDTTFTNPCIKVNGPKTRFNASTTNGCANTNILFRDSSITDGRNRIISRTWNFGDGTIITTTDSVVSHLYTRGGMFTISLLTTDSAGCSDLLTKTNYVTINKPISNFYTVDSVGCPISNINFINNAQGFGLTYFWNFGDGNTSTLTNPTHQYVTTGLYNVSLSIWDRNGCRHDSTKLNMVRISRPTARFQVSDTLGTCPPLIVNFTNQSSNQMSWSWDFGDGSGVVSTLNPSHFYAVAGTFQSKLIITSPGGCKDTAQKTIVVRGPSGTFSYAGLSGCIPTIVNFNANTRNTVRYTWDFSDGTALDTTSNVISHQYTTAGSFVPKVILRDTAGCTFALRGRDTIKIHGIDANFSFNTQTICDQGSVLFNSNVISTDPTSTYQWTFGDGTTSTTQNPNHFYNTTGIYYPKLIVTSTYGCKDTMISTNPIKIVKSPVANITQSINGCVPLNVNFNGLNIVADSSSLTWSWRFGNGNASNLMTPLIQTYSVAGNHPVQLIVTNSSGCKDTANAIVEAYAIPSINAGLDTTICRGTGINIQATGAVQYVWSPSRGLSCTTCASPIANPDSLQQYIVTGTSVHGCSSKDSVKVAVKYPFNMTTSRKDSLCIGNAVTMHANGAYRYTWTPSTGLDNPNSANPVATPRVSTTYQVVGTDDKNCFTVTATIPIIVHNYPTVEAGADRTINVGQTINIIPQVSSDVIDARWTPTNAIFRDIFPGITVKPNTTTTYKVVVKNKGGCKATDELTVNVLCNGANMFVPNTFSPNQDGVNDLFYPRGSGIFTIKRFKVFSRWGEVIFEQNNFNANDPSKGWDGTFKGKKLDPDVFIYTVDVMCDNYTVLSFKGNVALIK